nr:hypothetical protein [Chloroflexota bacterium]
MSKILILMSETGGGHRASAEAIRDAFRERYGAQFQVDMVDLWSQHTPPPINQVPKTYRFLVDDVPWLYKFIYEIGEKAELIDPLMKVTATFLSPFIKRTIEEYHPDLIVSVHPLMQQITLEVLLRMKGAIPFVTVVTDLITIPPVWFDPRVTLCFVPSDEGYVLARRAGLEPHQLRQLGLPIRPAFAQTPPPKSLVRQQLGLMPEVKAVLIAGGGEGMGPVGEIARAVAQRLAVNGQGARSPAGQLVVICGRNQELQRELSAWDWPVPAIIKGFVENIWDWMMACDCIITKAGPGTIAEACALGLPILLSGYIPGQESGNVPYVLKHGIGIYVTEPWQIAEVIAGWFGPQQDIMEQVAANARKLGHPQATFQIVEEIARLLSSNKSDSTSAIT